MNSRQKNAIRSVASLPESFNWRIDEGETIQCFHCKVRAPATVAAFPHRETCPVNYAPMIVREFLAAFALRSDARNSAAASTADVPRKSRRRRTKRVTTATAKAPYDRHAPRGRFAVFAITAQDTPVGDPLSRHRIAASAERKASGLAGSRNPDARFGVCERDDEGNWHCVSISEPRTHIRRARGESSAPRGRRGPRGPHKKFALIAYDADHPNGSEIGRYSGRSAAIVAYTRASREQPDASFEVRRRAEGAWETVWPKTRRAPGA